LDCGVVAEWCRNGGLGGVLWGESFGGELGGGDEDAGGGDFAQAWYDNDSSRARSLSGVISSCAIPPIDELPRSDHQL
jgi:hypothetical protein